MQRRTFYRRTFNLETHRDLHSFINLQSRDCQLEIIYIVLTIIVMFAEVATSFGTVKLLDDLLIIDNEISTVMSQTNMR